MATVAGSPSWVEPLSWAEQLGLNGAAFALGGAVASMLAAAQSAAERERSARLYEAHAKLKVAIVSIAVVSIGRLPCLPCLPCSPCCRPTQRSATYGYSLLHLSHTVAGRLGAQPHAQEQVRLVAVLTHAGARAARGGRGHTRPSCQRRGRPRHLRGEWRGAKQCQQRRRSLHHCRERHQHQQQQRQQQQQWQYPSRVEFRAKREAKARACIASAPGARPALLHCSAAVLVHVHMHMHMHVHVHM